jgi:hypothetical protein
MQLFVGEASQNLLQVRTGFNERKNEKYILFLYVRYKDYLK